MCNIQAAVCRRFSRNSVGRHRGCVETVIYIFPAFSPGFLFSHISSHLEALRLCHPPLVKSKQTPQPIFTTRRFTKLATAFVRDATRVRTLNTRTMQSVYSVVLDAMQSRFQPPHPPTSSPRPFESLKSRPSATNSHNWLSPSACPLVRPPNAPKILVCHT